MYASSCLHHRERNPQEKQAGLCYWCDCGVLDFSGVKIEVEMANRSNHLPNSCLLSIRQYELVVPTDINMNKVYTGEMGRLKSFETQKP